MTTITKNLKDLDKGSVIFSSSNNTQFDILLNDDVSIENGFFYTISNLNNVLTNIHIGNNVSLINVDNISNNILVVNHKESYTIVKISNNTFLIINSNKNLSSKNLTDFQLSNQSKTVISFVQDVWANVQLDLSYLNDIETSNIIENDILVYSNNKWKNKSLNSILNNIKEIVLI